MKSSSVSWLTIVIRKLTSLITLLVSLTFFSTAHADWTKMERGFKADVYYVDFKNIKKYEHLTYYWRLVDYGRPDPDGYFSNKSYMEVDCDQLGERHLLVIYFTLPMAEGDIAKTLKWKKEDQGSFYQPPNESVNAEMINKVCNHKP